MLYRHGRGLAIPNFPGREHLDSGRWQLLKEEPKPTAEWPVRGLYFHPTSEYDEHEKRDMSFSFRGCQKRRVCKQFRSISYRLFHQFHV
jgi:hypothetical protein